MNEIIKNIIIIAFVLSVMDIILMILLYFVYKKNNNKLYLKFGDSNFGEKVISMIYHYNYKKNICKIKGIKMFEEYVFMVIMRAIIAPLLLVTLYNIYKEIYLLFFTDKDLSIVNFKKDKNTYSKKQLIINDLLEI